MYTALQVAALDIQNTLPCRFPKDATANLKTRHKQQDHLPDESLPPQAGACLAHVNSTAVHCLQLEWSGPAVLTVTFVCHKSFGSSIRVVLCSTEVPRAMLLAIVMAAGAATFRNAVCQRNILP